MEKKNPNGKEVSSLVSEKSKVVCVGLNYRSHAEHAGFPIPSAPAIFCKFTNALAFDGDAVELPPWEHTYDYEAELVIVMGKTAWGVAKEDAMDCI